MRKLFLAAGLAALAVGGVARAAPPVIDGSRILRDIKTVSSDAFEGRAPATPGEEKTIAFLIEQMKAAGLQPAGDPLPGGGRAWTQDVPLGRYTAKGPITLQATAAGRTQTLASGDDMAIYINATGTDYVTIRDAPVVFVGYGVSAPELNWDNFKGFDLKGKIALVLVNDPDFETGKGDFGGEAMTYYGRWTYKFEEAARRGAVGFVIIHETAAAAYPWSTVKASFAVGAYDVIRPDPSKAHAPLEAWIQHDVAVSLMKAGGLDYDVLKREAQTRTFRPVDLKGVTLSVDYAVDAQKVVTHNVLGALPGTSHPDERVFYTGHWDHYGVGEPDAKGDRIYNGAADNGSGVGIMLELARAAAKAPRTARTQVFMLTTAEERNLLGATYYATIPLYPLATTVGVLNIDLVGTSGPARDVSTSGNAPLTLQDDLIAAAKVQGRYFTPDASPQSGFFYRSDHFPFAKAGVPAISFTSGADLVKGGKAAGEAKLKVYFAEHYHQPSDEFDPAWDPKGFELDATLLFNLGQRLANSRAWPEWKTGAEFKAERDKTRSERR